MRLRKLLGPAVLVAVVATFFLASTAFAGGWHKLGSSEGNNTNAWAPDEGLWSDTSKTNISSVARNAANVATIVTASNHYLVTGDIVNIDAADNTFDATGVTVTVVDGTIFTYSNNGVSVVTKADTGYIMAVKKVPHSNLQSSSNNCRTCHAVHNADNAGKSLGNGLDLNQDGDYLDAGETAPSTGTGQAFKMLRNESRATECYFCHGTSGALSNPIKKPYAPMFEDTDSNPVTPDVAVAAKGEHTLGATAIPDSTVNAAFLGTDGLTCGTCHSVHGGWTLNGVTGAGTLGTRILRRDAAQNGNRLAAGAAGGVANVASQGGSNSENTSGANEPTKNADSANDPTMNESQLLAAFCGDCHNKNVNWTTGGSGNEGDTVNGTTVNEGTRPNRYGHPLGNIDGLIDIYGKLGRVESTTDVNDIRTGPLTTENDNRMSCDDCHKSRQVGTNKFPHQSKSHKLLFDSYRDTSAYLDGGGGGGYTGNPDRPLPNLDAKVCRVCHGSDTATSYPGIADPSNSGSF